MRYLLTTLFLLSTLLSFGQAGRRFIRMGNRSYNKEDYTKAEVDYLRALSVDTTSYEAHYNLGNVLYKQGRMEDATRYFSKIAKDSSSVENVAATSYNLGNSLVNQRKLEEAIEAYKSSLRLNPSDTLAKQNLAYAQKLLENDQQGDGEDKQDNKNENSNDDQNQQQNQDNKQNEDGDNKNDQNQEQDQDENGDENQDQDQQNQGKNNQDENQQQQQQPQGGEMSRSEAEQMLDAIQRSEDDTQEKLNEKKGAVVGGRNIKNW